jgi:hypothetical protein
MSEEQPLSEAKASELEDLVSLPAHHVTNVYVTVSSPEITVALGRIHALLDPRTNGIGQTMRVEWFQSLALNPIVAKQLYLSLGRAVDFYESQFGKIPEDPNFRLANDADVAAGRPVV